MKDALRRLVRLSHCNASIVPIRLESLDVVGFADADAMDASFRWPVLANF